MTIASDVIELAFVTAGSGVLLVGVVAVADYLHRRKHRVRIDPTWTALREALHGQKDAA